MITLLGIYLGCSVLLFIVFVGSSLSPTRSFVVSLFWPVIILNSNFAAGYLHSKPFSKNYGFIAPPKQSKPVKEHECKWPITAFRSVGTLWRCKCGEVYRLKNYGDGMHCWTPAELEEWLAAGGRR